VATTNVPVQVRGVRKSFGVLEVISGIDVDVAPGEFVVLVGPSGCGKSTLLRMIAGLEDITDGEILISGTVVNTLAPKDRDVAMVFQSYALYPQKTVYENMAFGLRMRKAPATTISERVQRATQMLGLGPVIERLPKQLSGGQRQRVAMGRAMVRAPKVFLFDEPLSNLDAKLRVQMRTEIKARHAALATTTIYVTHDQVEAMTLADRIVVMNAGKIEQVGPPLELYWNPVNTFVAGFIGSPSMNLIPVKIKRGREQIQAETDDGVLLPLPPALSIQQDRALYGIRPEHVQVGDTGIERTVEVVEPTGADTQLTVQIGGKPIAVVYRDLNQRQINRGDKVRLAPIVEAVRLFDPESGRRLPLQSRN
jgi:multiple sugar transport system ATP-binding protein